LTRTKRFAVGLGFVTAAVALGAGAALGSSGGKHAAAGKSLIVIKDRGSAQQSTDGRFRGRFSLLLNGVIEDSGLSVITS